MPAHLCSVLRALRIVLEWLLCVFCLAIGVESSTIAADDSYIVFSVFNMSAPSLDLVNADYTVGLLTSYRKGPLRLPPSPPPGFTSGR